MSNPRPLPSIEEGIDAFLVHTGRTLRHSLAKCEKDIRRSPAQAVLAAAAAGYCLHQLPMRAIVMTNVRLAAALVRPALFLLGTVRLYDFLQRQAVPAPAKS